MTIIQSYSVVSDLASITSIKPKRHFQTSADNMILLKHYWGNRVNNYLQWGKTLSVVNQYWLSILTFLKLSTKKSNSTYCVEKFAIYLMGYIIYRVILCVACPPTGIDILSCKSIRYRLVLRCIWKRKFMHHTTIHWKSNKVKQNGYNENT